MNTNQSSTQAAETLRAKLTAPTKLTILAWIVVLIGSMVPTIIFRQFVPAAPGESVLPIWLAWAQVIVLAILVAVTFVWPAIKPLRGLILALLAFCIGAFFIISLIRGSAAWTNWVQQVSWGVALVTNVVAVHLGPVVLMSLSLVGSGLGRRELFLTRGNPNAPAQPSLLFNIKEGETKPWTRLASQFILIYVVILVIVIWLSVQPDLSQFSQALIFLPAIIIAAALNALAEEYQYRSVLLARLEPVVKPGMAMLMSAVFFTSLHYYTGTPSGPLAAIAVMFLGWVTAKSVLETRGLVWAWLLHFIADFVIYSFAAMSI